MRLFDALLERFGRRDYNRARRLMIELLRARPELEHDVAAVLAEVDKRLRAERAAHEAYERELQRRREALPSYKPPPPPGYGVGGGGN